MPATELISYADLNCPFCFVLFQRLTTAEQEIPVIWRLVEHDPGIERQPFSIKKQSELSEEVYQANRLAPDVLVCLPQRRPCTRLANELFIKTLLYFPEKANELLATLFKALWWDGIDISRLDNLRNILEPLEVGHLLDIPCDPDVQNRKHEWQLSWELSSNKDLLPVLQFQDGKSLNGLPEPSELSAFLSQQEITLSYPGHCDAKPKADILILGENDAIWPFVSAIRGQYNMRVVDSFTALHQYVDTTRSPAAILLDGDQLTESLKDICCLIQQCWPITPPAIFVVMDDITEEQQIAAWRCGMTDLISHRYTPALFKEKFAALVNLKQDHDYLQQAAWSDSVTGLGNQKKLYKTLSKEWRRDSRIQTPVSLLIINLDFFRDVINRDQSKADKMIQQVAEKLNDSISRACDKVCRFNDDTFAMVLPNTDHKGACHLAEQVREGVEALQIDCPTSEVCAHLTVSVGVATMVPDLENQFQSLIDSARERQQLATSTSRNRVYHETSMLR